MRCSGPVVILVTIFGAVAGCGQGVSRDPLPGPTRLSGLWSPCGKLGHGPPLRVAVAGNGSVEAISFADGTIAVQRAADHSLVAAIADGGGTELALSFNGGRLAIAGANRLAVRRTADGTLVFERPGATLGVALTADENKLLVVTAAHEVELRDAADGALLESFGPFLGAAVAAAFDSDGNNVSVYDSAAGGVSWQGRDGVRFVPIAAGTAPLEARLSPRGDYLAIVTFAESLELGRNRYVVEMYDAVTGARLWSLDQNVARSPPPIAFSSDNLGFVISNQDRLLALQVEGTFPFLSDTIAGPIPGISLNQVTSVAANGSGLWLADASGVYTAARTNPTERVRVSALPGQGLAVMAVAFSPDGRWLVTAGYPDYAGPDPLLRNPGDVTIWDLSTRRPRQTIHDADASSLSFSSDSRRLLVGAGGVSQLREYPIGGGDSVGRAAAAWLSSYGAKEGTALLSSWDGVAVVPIAGSPGDEEVLVRMPYPGLALSPNRQFIATTGPALWRADGGSLVWPDTVTPAVVRSDAATDDNWVAFSPDGAFILTSDFQNAGGPPWTRGGDTETELYTTATRLFRTRDGAMVKNFGAGLARRPQFSPDGAWIVAGNRVYAVEGDTSVELSLTAGLASVSAFAPDGTIAVGREDGVIELYCPM
jgi:WD40 repeat protein